MVVSFVPRFLCLLILRLCYFKWTEFPIYNEYYELSMDGGVFSDEIHLAYFYLMCSRSDFISFDYHSWLADCFLLLAGDVALNPGPFRYPCSVCSRPVRSNQRGIQCDGCCRWTHAVCAGVSEDMWMDMTSQGEFPWHCPPCLLSQLLFPDTSALDSSVSSISSDDNVDRDLLLISDVLSTPPVRLRVVHHNVQGLLSKWTDLQGWLSDAAPSGGIFCFSETWLKPGLPQPQFSGFQAYFSPHLRHSSSCSMQSFLPGSCLFVSSMLSPEHPSICDDIEHSLVSLNVSCCFITCRQ